MEHEDSTPGGLDGPGMYPTSDSESLTAEQCRELDCSMFESNAPAYWRSRIDMLLREPAPVDYSADLAAEIAALGLDPRMLADTQPSEREREQQRALDAFALRQHIAESLVRLVHGVVTVWERPCWSVWAEMASNRDDGAALVNVLRQVEESGVPFDLFLPIDEANRFRNAPPEELLDGVRIHWQWVRRAMDLLVNDRLDTNAGNNKLKHGFAVRQRDDLRIEFVTTPPNEDGTIPLSAFERSVPIIDAVAFEFLERLPKRHSHAGSWEVTVLNLRPAPLLAEALMLSTVWTSVFVAAASRHWDGREAEAPTYPRLLALGPPPQRVTRAAVGLRQSLTAPTNGAAPRGFVVETPDSTVTLTPTGRGKRGVNDATADSQGDARYDRVEAGMLGPCSMTAPLRPLSRPATERRVLDFSDRQGRGLRTR